jgi:hypothetical protein
VIVDREGAIKQLQDIVIVVEGVQARQAEVQKESMAQFDAKMLDIEDKLNGLIGFIDGRIATRTKMSSTSPKLASSQVRTGNWTPRLTIPTGKAAMRCRLI